MIRLNNKLSSVWPAKLLTDGVAETEKLKKGYENGERNFMFYSSIYGHKEVKNELIELQHDKCCFCESKIGHTDFGDVEHFRPKGGWVQDDETIFTPGYYWLAYNWDNLFLSCKKCNQRHKRNFFPLLNDKRAFCHTDNIDDELPIFIHPVFDNPESHIEFIEEEVYEKDDSIRGKVTVEKLGLDRIPLTNQRREKLKPIKHLYSLYKSVQTEEIELKNKTKEIIKEYYFAAQQDSTEYASMLRCFFRKNPIDF
jgi:uncharacterized protein (TIGR02646 family)